MTRRQIKEQIEIMLQQDSRKLELPLMPLNYLKEVIEETGFKHKQGHGDTNGWQVDFLEVFEHPTYGMYRLSGSLWHGEYKLIKEEK